MMRLMGNMEKFGRLFEFNYGLNTLTCVCIYIRISTHFVKYRGKTLSSATRNENEMIRVSERERKKERKKEAKREAFKRERQKK